MEAHNSPWDHGSYFNIKLNIFPWNSRLWLYKFTESVDDNTFLRGWSVMTLPTGVMGDSEGPLEKSGGKSMQSGIGPLCCY